MTIVGVQYPQHRIVMIAPIVSVEVAVIPVAAVAAAVVECIIVVDARVKIVMVVQFHHVIEEK